MEEKNIIGDEIIEEDLTYINSFPTTTPTIILCTKYRHHIGAISNVSNINTIDNMSSAQEISFDVYNNREVDSEGELLNFGSIWEQITDGKQIYVPEKSEYYEITVNIDEQNNTVKHVTGTSACEAELDNKLLRNFEVNTTDDIARENYKPTKFYNPQDPEASLLDRVLKDKAFNYKIFYVDKSLWNIQRTFSVDKESIYKFLTTTVAEEIGCLFVFDSVHRDISVFDLKNICKDCGHRGDMTDTCPKCGSTNIQMGYGEDSKIYISSDNYASSISVEGKYEEVKNCFKVEGGDDLMTATVINCNPNGSGYIYSFSDDMLNDMPEELVEKIADYNILYEEIEPKYQKHTVAYYEYIDEELRLTSEMMPNISMQDTNAQEQLDILLADDSMLKRVAVEDTTSLSKSSADIAVKNLAKVLVDMRYSINIISSTLQSGDSYSSNSYYADDGGELTPPIVGKPMCLWQGIIEVVNNSDEEDVARNTEPFSIYIDCNHFDEYLHQKILKTLDRDDMCLQSIFKIEDIEVFKEELTKYCLDMLVGFESAYQTCLEVMIENGITDIKDIYGVNVYEKMYVPYYEKKQCIQKEIQVREKEIEQVYYRKRNEDRTRKSLSEKLNFQKFLGDELWSIFCLYLREDTYSNNNYISDGLSNSELVKRAVELVDAAKEEAKRACENQITLTMNLSNMLLDDNLLQFLKNKPEIGDWLMVSVDDTLYKLRLIAIEANYDNLQDIKFTFSNVIKAKNVLTDAKDLLSKAKSIAGSFDYVAHQASQGSDLKLEMNEYREEGIAGEEIKIYNDKNQQVLVDEHGISCRQYDDITEDYSPKQMRIINNVLAFTKDNWQTVDTAIGEIQYSLGDEMFYDYGVKANTIVSGKFIGGDIYSSNYKIKTNPITGEEYVYGSHIGLNDGSFEIGDGSLTYNKSNGLDIKANLSFLGSLYTYQRQIAFDDSGKPYYIPTDNFEVMGYSEIDDSIHFRDSEGNYLFYSNQNEFAINKNARLRFNGNLRVDKPDGGINNVDIGTTSLDDIGDGTITGAIQSCFQSVSNGKALIADAITGKGVSTSATDTFEVMANNISAIQSGDSTIKYDLLYLFKVDRNISNATIIISALCYPNNVFKPESKITVKVNNKNTYYCTFKNTTSVPTILNASFNCNLDKGTNMLVITSPDKDVIALSMKVSTPDSIPPLTSDETIVDGLTYRTSASTVYNTNRTSYMPFNGTNDLGGYDCWHPDKGAPQWLKLELPYAMCIRGFTMQNRQDYVECPKDVIFQGSTNGENWDDIHSFVFNDGGERGVTKIIETDNVDFYKFYRWYIETVNYDYGVIAKIKDIEIYSLKDSYILQNINLGY